MAKGLELWLSKGVRLRERCGECPCKEFSHHPTSQRDYRLGGVEKEQRRRDSKPTVYTWSADILAVKFHNTQGVLRLELSRITQTISTMNFFRLAAIPQVCNEPLK